MSRIVLLLLAFGLFGASLLASGAVAQRAPLFDDANAMLDRIIDEKWLTARGVCG